MSYKFLFLLPVLLFNNSVLSGQEDQVPFEGNTIEIENLADLKNAIGPTTLFQVFQSMDTWMPKLVASTNWETQLSTNMVLNYYIDHRDTNDVLFENFLAESDSIIEELELFFEIQPDTKGEHLATGTRLITFIIKTKAELTFGTLPDPHLLFYYLDPVKDPKYMQRLRHEYAHWAFGRIYGEAPSLFYEGVATYAEKQSGRGQVIPLFPTNGLELDKIPLLSTLASNDSFWGTRHNYTISALFIDFLVTEWGWDKLKAFFLKSDYEDPQVNEHIKDIYGFGLEELDIPFREFLEKKKPVAQK